MTLQDALAQSLKAMLGHMTTELHFIGQNLLLSQQTEGDDGSKMNSSPKIPPFHILRLQIASEPFLM